VEEVEDPPRDTALLLPEEILREVVRQGGDGPVEAHEGDGHLVAGLALRPVGPPDLGHVGGSERHVERRPEPEQLLRGRARPAHARAVGERVLQEAHHLEEGEPVPFRHDRARQRMIRSPIRVGHSCISPNLSPFTRRWQKAFTETNWA